MSTLTDQQMRTPSRAEMEAMLKPGFDTDITQVVHNDAYSAISPSRSASSQKGKSVLITGGGTAIGLATAKAFVTASSDIVIILGRRADVIANAAHSLEEVAKVTGGNNTKIVAHILDVTDRKAVDALWAKLADDNITVDVFVSNASMFGEEKPLLEQSVDELWKQFDTNVQSPFYFISKFYAQNSDKQKYLIHTSSQAAHQFAEPTIAKRPSYTFTKLSGTLLVQLIAQNTTADKLQIISFHPGIIYNETWQQWGFPQDLFNKDTLPAAFAVWAATKEASFLHGRFAWASWDVEELATGKFRERLDKDPYYLRASIVGLNGGLGA